MNKSYAKINLVLEVLNKRSDNYHNIRSIVCLIDLHDDIEIKINNLNKNVIINKGIKIPLDNKNFMIQVLVILKAYFHINNYFTIYINKKIPLNSGLGGGSSNAAYVIKWFLKKYGLSLDDKVLNMLLKVSSDINIFLKYFTPMIILKKGDYIKPLWFKIIKEILILTPKQKLNSQKMYQLYDLLTIKKKNNKVNNFIKSQGSLEFIHNDFEFVLEKFYPQLFNLKKILKKITNEKIFLTGKGSSFIVFKKINSKEVKNIEKLGLNVIFAKTLNE